MQQISHSALPEGVPPEGLKIIKATSEDELEKRFAELATQGYVPAQQLKIIANFDEHDKTWSTLYVLPLWRVGASTDGETEEMFR